jgi:hypothetical protein
MQVSLLNVVVELKKCCNHPFLFESADHGYGGDTSDSNKIERMVLSSGKLVLLDKLLIRLRETNHRVLIFSQVGLLLLACARISFYAFLWGVVIRALLCHNGSYVNCHVNVCLFCDILWDIIIA